MVPLPNSTGDSSMNLALPANGHALKADIRNHSLAGLFCSRWGAAVRPVNLPRRNLRKQSGRWSPVLRCHWQAQHSCKPLWPGGHSPAQQHTATSRLLPWQGPQPHYSGVGEASEGGPGRVLGVVLLAAWLPLQCNGGLLAVLDTQVDR